MHIIIFTYTWGRGFYASFMVHAAKQTRHLICKIKIHSVESSHNLSELTKYFDENSWTFWDTFLYLWIELCCFMTSFYSEVQHYNYQSLFSLSRARFLHTRRVYRALRKLFFVVTKVYNLKLWGVVSSCHWTRLTILNNVIWVVKVFFRHRWGQTHGDTFFIRKHLSE